ncbi:hypothetical protein AWN76_013755 [Rhodothermaceae bacterium RA]|nr:hypothetical protein AWN76_013755 [Rhodothermaceae bacterium RA]
MAEHVLVKATMKTMHRIKLTGAVLLLLSAALPMSSCSHFEDAEGNRVTVAEGEAVPEGVQKVVTYNYAFEDFDAAEAADWLLPAAFLWPLLVVGLLWRWSQGPVAVMLRLAEPVLLVGSAYLIAALVAWGERPEAGAYVAFAALAIYAGAAVWEDVRRGRAWWQDRQAGLPPQASPTAAA